MNKTKTSTLRTVTILLALALTVAGLAFKSGSGTLSAFGYSTISAICPLGSLETMLASRTFLPRTLVSLVVLLALAILIGRVFCAWVCPVPLVRRIFPSRFKDKDAVGGAEESPLLAEEQAVGGGEIIPDDVKAEVKASEPHAEGMSAVKIDSRHWVLGGALLSTAVFGFPVFCLVCPIGLTFATIIGLWRLFNFNEPTITLLVFPAVLVLELLVFRKWCTKICPLGALVSIVSSLNIFARPRVDEKKCLRTTRGIDCRACKNACFEEIDLHHATTSKPLSECTKCRECSEACPVSAISFPWSPKKRAGVAVPVSQAASESGEEG